MKGFFICTIMLLLTTGQSALASSLSAEQILMEIDKVEKYDHVYMETRQTITTSNGDKRTLKIKSWSMDTGDKQLSVYTYPKRVSGVKILMLNDGDDIWSYSPKTRRTRHLASHAKKQKVMGSDFSYEDIGGGKMSKRYTGAVVKEETIDGINCFVLDLKPTPKGPSYDRILAWVGKTDFAIRKIDYFDDGNQKAFKTLFLKKIKKISGHLVPMEMTMKNNEDGGETENISLSVDFNKTIKADIFDSQKLDR